MRPCSSRLGAKQSALAKMERPFLGCVVKATGIGGVKMHLLLPFRSFLQKTAVSWDDPRQSAAEQPAPTLSIQFALTMPLVRWGKTVALYRRDTHRPIHGLDRRQFDGAIPFAYLHGTKNAVDPAKDQPHSACFHSSCASGPKFSLSLKVRQIGMWRSSNAMKNRKRVGCFLTLCFAYAKLRKSIWIKNANLRHIRLQRPRWRGSRRL